MFAQKAQREPETIREENQRPGGGGGIAALRAKRKEAEGQRLAIRAEQEEVQQAIARITLQRIVNAPDDLLRPLLEVLCASNDTILNKAEKALGRAPKMPTRL